MELIVRDQSKEQRFIETAEKIAARPIESLKPIKDDGEFVKIAGLRLGHSPKVFGNHMLRNFRSARQFGCGHISQLKSLS